MKTFLTTVKGKIMAGVGTVVVIGAIVTLIVVLNSGYRTIAVHELNGLTTIVNGSKTGEAYAGLKLKQGDDVTVSDSGDLTLAMDQDKHVYAEPKTHFWIEAQGKLNNTRTRVYMDKGSNLFRIDNKLRENENFKVDTPNSTMSVRGTVFRVTCEDDPNGYFYTKIEVFEGEVYVEAVMEDGTATSKNRSLFAGECAIIYSDPTVSDFVTDETGLTVLPIDYKEIPKATAAFLGLCIDDGRTLCIEKDLLFDYTGINDHEFGDDVEIAVSPTCAETGSGYRVCLICGEKSEEKTVIEKVDHVIVSEDYPGETCDDPGYILYVCTECKEVVSREDYDHKDHDFEEKIVKEATATKEGEKLLTCKACGVEKTEKIEKLCINGHTYKAVGAATKAGCSEDGVQNYTCEVCGTKKAEVLEKATGHDYVVTEENSPDCTHAGMKTLKCSKCGDITTKTGEGALGHIFVFDSVAAEATCSQPGEEFWKCTRCGETESREIAVNDNHKYRGFKDVTAGAATGARFWHTCSVCGKTEGCTDDGTRHCKICHQNMRY
ncbi:MAG: FecR family protein [Lachnospiraceae bacterium]|nr:FecR family protein [Lachnospiraceae bacterium]